MVGRQHTMAGYEDRDRVGTASAANRAERFRFADSRGYLSVTERLATTYPKERRPYLLLKFCAGGEIERWQLCGGLTGQDSRQRFRCLAVPLLHRWRKPSLVNVGAFGFRTLREVQFAQALFGIAREEFSVRSWNGELNHCR